LRSPIASSTGRTREDRRVYRLAAAVWALVILTATSVPASNVPSGLPQWTDKIVHFALYCVLGFLAVRALRAPTPIPAAAKAEARIGAWVAAGWLVLALLAIFAGVDEYHQHWIRGRVPSSGDWIADVLGAGFGIAIGTHICRSIGNPESGIDRETNS